MLSNNGFFLQQVHLFLDERVPIWIKKDSNSEKRRRSRTA